MKVAWVESVEITIDGIYTLRAAEISDETYRIDLGGVGGPYKDYLLIENSYVDKVACRNPLFDWSANNVLYDL